MAHKWSPVAGVDASRQSGLALRADSA